MRQSQTPKFKISDYVKTNNAFRRNFMMGEPFGGIITSIETSTQWDAKPCEFIDSFTSTFNAVLVKVGDRGWLNQDYFEKVE